MEEYKQKGMKKRSYEDMLEILAAEKEVYPPIGKRNWKLLNKYWKIVLTDTEPSDDEKFEKEIDKDKY